ncbi:MAG: winged helix-turn-helix transcriptional regulator [Candidatus Bathyarchaeota archaeon]|jgi:DNA-binding Lrp family transcriptional regulator
MKTIELKVLSELMKNARLSDRELAKRVGCSQPTATRVRNKLEGNAFIKEYTTIPDFSKIGYEIMAFTFFKFSRVNTQEEIEKVRKIIRTGLQRGVDEVIMAERGMGMEYNGVAISLHRRYSDYTKFIDDLQQYSDILGVSEARSFLVNLRDPIQYRYLTLATLAKHLRSS